MRFGNDCAPFVRVEDKSKLIFLNSTEEDKVGNSFDEIVKEADEKVTALEYKNMGNKDFLASNYRPAINLYKRGIAKVDKSDKDLMGALYGNTS